MTDDSEQDLDLLPNRRGSSYRGDFGGNNMLRDLVGPQQSGPFCAGFRS